MLLLFDGLDEVNSSERPEVVQRIKDLIDQCSKCRVLITCRTQVYKNEFSEVVDGTLEVVEFTDQEIQNFLQPWQSSMSADKSVEQLLRNLHDRPRIIALARNPLMLTIIAYLYTDTP
ncbi:MAG: NACHT domain-containing protein, partial [Pseudanabaena sp.]